MSYASLTVEELIRVCSDTGKNEAWQEFVRRFHSVIAASVYRIARRWGESSPSVIDDLVQETYLKVCANNFRLMREFQAQHPDAFYAVLKVTAANAAHDYFRAKRNRKRGAGAEEEELSEAAQFVSDAHGPGPAQIEREILLGEIDAILANVKSPTQARDREIFWLYYRQGLTAEAIADIGPYQLTTKGVESILFRLKKVVREAMTLSEKCGSGQMGLNQGAKRSEKGICAQSAFIEGEGQP